VKHAEPLRDADADLRLVGAELEPLGQSLLHVYRQGR
jgi:hypothetical protein